MTTLSASSNSCATLSTSASRISPEMLADDAASPPHPPKITETKERFIPLHIMYERIAPEEPTKSPVTIRRSLLRVKPIAAAAQPEYEFSIETTTGMSAPPIPRMRWQPNAPAINVIRISVQSPASARYKYPSHTHSRIAARFKICLPGKVRGAELSRSASLP